MNTAEMKRRLDSMNPELYDRVLRMITDGYGAHGITLESTATLKQVNAVFAFRTYLRDAGTITQVQETAIAYARASARPNDHRVNRKAGRMVREYCVLRGYSPEETGHCVRDMYDMLRLERECVT